MSGKKRSHGFVIGTLWEVSDASTPQLMDEFYSELKKGAISRRCPAPGETFPAPLGRCLPKAFLLGSVSDVHRFLNHYKEILLFRNVKPERLDQIEHPKASFCI